MEGDAVCGILSATYGGHLAETFDTWRTTTLALWRSAGLGPTVFTSELYPDPWFWPVAHTLGGCAYDVNPRNEYRVAGIRAPPHSIAAHAFKQSRSENIRGKTTSIGKRSNATPTARPIATNIRIPARKFRMGRKNAKGIKDAR